MYNQILFVWVRNRVLVIISSIYKSSQLVHIFSCEIHNEPGVCIHGPTQFMMSWQILVVVGGRGLFTNLRESVKLMSSCPQVHVEVGLLMALHNTTLLGSAGSSSEFQKTRCMLFWQ